MVLLIANVLMLFSIVQSAFLLLIVISSVVQLRMLDEKIFLENVASCGLVLFVVVLKFLSPKGISNYENARNFKLI